MFFSASLSSLLPNLLPSVLSSPVHLMPHTLLWPLWSSEPRRDGATSPFTLAYGLLPIGLTCHAVCARVAVVKTLKP